MKELSVRFCPEKKQTAVYRTTMTIPVFTVFEILLNIPDKPIRKKKKMKSSDLIPLEKKIKSIRNTWYYYFCIWCCSYVFTNWNCIVIFRPYLC